VTDPASGKLCFGPLYRSAVALSHVSTNSVFPCALAAAIASLSPQQLQNATDTRTQQGLEQLPQLVAGVMSNDAMQQLQATVTFRKLLSIESNPPISQVIATGVVPRFVTFLQSQSPKLQFEAAWTLTNIASGTSTETRVVVDAGAVPVFVALLRSPHDNVREQAIWALGNIAGDSPNWRDYVLSFDAMTLLLENFTDMSRDSLIRNAIWTLSNFCRGKPQPSFTVVERALPVLAFMIRNDDADVLADACWALSYLSDGPNEKIQAVINADVLPRLVELLEHKSYSVQTPALRCIGNIVTGDDQQTQKVIDLRALHSLAKLLDSPKRSIRKETCWALSNITAGNQLQIQAVIDAGVVPTLVSMLQVAPLEIKKEVCWALSNATSGGSLAQIDYLVEFDVIRPLLDMLVVNDVKIVTVALEGIENILRAGARADLTDNPYALIVDECGGVARLEAMFQHHNHEIYRKSSDMLALYFGGEEEDGVVTGGASIAPQVAPSGQLQFGYQPQQQPSNAFLFDQ
jgi:importin subunit alpha-1